MKFRPKPCKTCSETFTPTGGNQQTCSRCRPARRLTCTDCGVSFTPTKHTSHRCSDCVIAINPRSIRCPYPCCLQAYVPDSRHPHECPKGRKTQPVPAYPDLVVMYGPPLSDRAIGVGNRAPATPPGPETLGEAEAWDRRKGAVLASGMSHH